MRFRNLRPHATAHTSEAQGRAATRRRPRRQFGTLLGILALACIAIAALGPAGPASAAGPADGAELTAPAAHYYGIGVMPSDTPDSAYLDASPVQATATSGGTTVTAHLTFGNPAARTPFTLGFTVSSGATAGLAQYGTIERPDEAAGGPIQTAPILLYLAGTGSTPIGTPVTLQLSSRYTADPNLPANEIALEVNGVRYAVGSPASIPLNVGSLIQLYVGTNFLATPSHTSSLTVSLLPTLTSPRGR